MEYTHSSHTAVFCGGVVPVDLPEYLRLTALALEKSSFASAYRITRKYG